MPELYNDYFKKVETNTNPTQEEIELWVAVKQIHENVKVCIQEYVCEAGWGEKVYSKLFDAALKIPQFKNTVGWWNT